MSSSLAATTSTAVIREEDEFCERADSQNREQLPTANISLKKEARSKKFFDQWKQAASMSKLGNRTKNLLGKFKSHSQSVDAANSGSFSNQGPSCRGTNTLYSYPKVFLCFSPFIGSNQTNLIPRNGHDGFVIQPGVLGTEPGSNDGPQIVADKQETQPTTKGKAQWSEHVWSE